MPCMAGVTTVPPGGMIVLDGVMIVPGSSVIVPGGEVIFADDRSPAGIVIVPDGVVIVAIGVIIAPVDEGNDPTGIVTMPVTCKFCDTSWTPARSCGDTWFCVFDGSCP